MAGQFYPPVTHGVHSNETESTWISLSKTVGGHTVHAGDGNNTDTNFITAERPFTVRS